MDKAYLDRAPTDEDRQRIDGLCPKLTQFYREQYPQLSGVQAEGGVSASEWDAVVEQLMVLTRERAVGNKIIIVIASEKWEAMLMNWMVKVNALGLSNFIIFAADPSLATNLRRLDAPVFEYNVKHGKEWHYFHQQLWMQRWRLIAEIIKRGIDVVHSDADAVVSFCCRCVASLTTPHSLPPPSSSGSPTRRPSSTCRSTSSPAAGPRSPTGSCAWDGCTCDRPRRCSSFCPSF